VSQLKKLLDQFLVRLQQIHRSHQRIFAIQL
jgi:hypothetical protein